MNLIIFLIDISKEKLAGKLFYQWATRIDDFFPMIHRSKEKSLNQEFMLTRTQTFIVYIWHRIAELSDEVERIRPPRRFYSDKIIRPFNLVEATGFNILQVNCILLSLGKQYWLKYQERRYCVVLQSICNLDGYRKLSFQLFFSWKFFPLKYMTLTGCQCNTRSNSSRIEFNH